MRLRISGGNTRRGQVGVGAGISDFISNMAGK